MGAGRPEGLEVGPGAIESLVRNRIHELQLDALPEYTKTPMCFRLEDESLRVEAINSHDVTLRKLSTALYSKAVRATCTRLRDAVRETLHSNPETLPIVLGGDHSIAIGTIAGLLAAKRNRTVGVIWIDSHADYNTGYRDDPWGKSSYESWKGAQAGSENVRGTSTTGYIHGMSLAVATGSGEAGLKGIYADHRFVDPRHVTVIGVREVDREERDWIHKDGIRCYSARSVAYLGVPRVLDRALTHLSEQGVQDVHVSLDIDALDASLVPGTGTPVPGGLSFREADLLMKLIRDWLPPSGMQLASFELVEVNPLLDKDSQTSQLAARLICTLLGEEILVGEAIERPTSEV